MPSRRDFLAVALATAAVASTGAGRGAGLRAQSLRQLIRQEDLLRFRPVGQLTLLHMTDCHGQLVPHYFREPSLNLGVGEAKGLPPHITDRELLAYYGIDVASYRAYALSSADFEALARVYGRVGGLDRMATLVKAIRADRGEPNTLLLDGGDTLQGSYSAMTSRGAAMVKAMEALGVEATTGHWEFTLGDKRIAELFGDKDGPGSAKMQFLAGNVVDDEWQEPVFKSTAMFERAGTKVAVIGQAFPFTPIANPRWMMPKWSFGIREDVVRRNVEAARAAGAELVVLLSHNGFDVDRKLASRVQGIDVILTAHTHDALPRPYVVGRTLLVATGSSGKFLSRLDIEMKGGRMAEWSYGLIPVLSDVIRPDPAMARLIEEIRAPDLAMLQTPLGKAEAVLYRRGNFNGTFDDLICDAMLQERDAEICLSPGFRWGTSLLPGHDITWEDIYNQTAMTYPACYRTEMKGAMLKDILEDVADNLFHRDPYYQQGGDMVRVGGLGYTIDVDAEAGSRISKMVHLRSGAAIDPGRSYVVAGWASVGQDTQGPPIWDVVANYLRGKKAVTLTPHDNVRIVRGKG